VRAVFFDAVGTLLVPHPSAPEIYAAVAERHKLMITVEDVLKRFQLAFDDEENTDRLSGWVTDESRELHRWQQIVEFTLSGVSDPNACFRELFHHFSRPEAWRITADANLVLNELQNRGLTLGIGSNFDARLWRIVHGFPALTPVREHIVISAAVGFRKPAPRFFQHVVRIAGCAPEELLFVGDDYSNDYLGARSVGLNAILVHSPINTPGPNCRIESLCKLLDAF